MTINELVATITKSARHRYLYHFTDKSNFPSIGAKGLMSKVQMRKEGWWPDATGGNQLSWDLDAYSGISAHLFRQHPPICTGVSAQL